MTKKKVFFFLVNLLIFLGFYLSIIWSYNYTKHRIDFPNKWLSLKMVTFNKPMGDAQFVYDRNSVAQDKVNLGYWFGNQELLMPLALSNSGCINIQAQFNRDSIAKFRFRPKSSDYLILVLTNSHFEKNSWVIANQKDRYLSRSLIKIDYSLKGHKRVKLCHYKDRVDLFVEDKKLSSFETKIFQKDVYFSIGSGVKDFFIDEIEVLNSNGERLFFDDFNFDRSLFLIFGLSLISAIFFSFFFIYKRDFLLLLLSTSICVFLYLTVDYFVLSKQKPVGNNDEAINDLLLVFNDLKNKTFNLIPSSDSSNLYTILKEKDFLTQLIPFQFDGYEHAILRNIGEEDSKIRILFLGTSQASGEGATKKEFQIPETLQTCMSKRMDQSVLLTSIAMKGGNAEMIYRYVLDNHINPSDFNLLLISLGNNDFEHRKFKKYIGKIIEWARTNNSIKIALAHEPTSPDSYAHLKPNRLNLYTLMSFADPRNRTFFIETMSISSPETFQSGDLWWDYVHMKNYGHYLYASLLCDQSLKYINTK